MTAPVQVGDGVARDSRQIYRELLRLDRPCFVVRNESGAGVTTDPELARRTQVLASVPPLPPESLGDREFLAGNGDARCERSLRGEPDHSARNRHRRYRDEGEAPPFDLASH